MGQASYLGGTKSKKKKQHLFENQVLIKNSDSADFGKMTYPLWTVAPGETEYSVVKKKKKGMNFGCDS